LQVQVVFPGTDDIRKSNLIVIQSQIVEKERLSRLILVVQSKMTSYARKELENCPFKVEIINVS
jgi:DNA-directed RNA polymerases I, II, and III subunit RPABC1